MMVHDRDMSWTVTLKESVLDDLRWFGKKDGRLLLREAEGRGARGVDVAAGGVGVVEGAHARVTCADMPPRLYRTAITTSGSGKSWMGRTRPGLADGAA